MPPNPSLPDLTPMSNGARRLILYLVVTAIAAVSYLAKEHSRTARAAELRDRAQKVYGEKPSGPNDKRVIGENVVAYTTANEALLAAREKARETLPRFQSMLESHEPGTYSVKFPLTQNGRTEHIWLVVSSVSSKGFTGRLDNEPVNGAAYKMGQEMTVSAGQIEDWMVRTAGGIYGGYVVRVQIQDLPEPRRSQIVAQFRD